MRHILPILLAAAIMATLIALDVAKPLGAHPWWSQKTLLIGTPVGLICAALLGRLFGPVGAFVVFVGMTAVAFAIAKYGQTQFAASYAEDALAGKLWYFGWIATGAAIAATLTSAVQMVQQIVASR